MYITPSLGDWYIRGKKKNDEQIWKRKKFNLSTICSGNGKTRYLGRLECLLWQRQNKLAIVCEFFLGVSFWICLVWMNEFYIHGTPQVRRQYLHDRSIMTFLLICFFQQNLSTVQGTWIHCPLTSSSFCYSLQITILKIINFILIELIS